MGIGEAVGGLRNMGEKWEQCELSVSSFWMLPLWDVKNERENMGTIRVCEQCKE